MYKTMFPFLVVSSSDGGMKITWVDDTHALAVFSSETAGRFPSMNTFSEQPRFFAINEVLYPFTDL